MGILGYPVDKIINILEITDTEQFKADFKNKAHEIFNRYQVGKDKADYIIDSKLFEMAKAGDLAALAKYEQRQFKNQQK